MKKGCLGLVMTVVTVGLLLAGSAPWAAEKDLPKMLSLGTMPVGTTVNMAGSGLAVLINAHTPINVKVMPVANENVWIPMMASGEVHMGVGIMPEVEYAFLGKGLWAKAAEQMKIKGFPVRIVALGAKAYLGFNVRGDSPYKKISDLKGAKVARYAPGSGVQDFVLASLANGGLSPEDVNFIPIANPVEGGKALMDGRVDASYVAPDAPIIIEMATKVGARYVPHDMSAEAQARVKAVNHELRVEMPEVTYANVLEEKIPMMVFDWALFASPDVSEDAIYEITKVLVENEKELKGKSALDRWHAERFCSPDVYVPYHEGAVKYYKEKGLWKDDVNKVQEALLQKAK